MLGKFAGYRKFTFELRKLAKISSLSRDQAERVEACLDGVAGAELRQLVKLKFRRARGAFFTGSKLAGRLFGQKRFNPAHHFIYDPAVGAGDLLLASARRLPIRQTLADTLRAWGTCLAGTDLQPEFVEATKLRIALLARQRHGNNTMLPKKWRQYFPFIHTGDGLAQRDLYSRATHVTMNPPFCLSEPNDDCEWAGGKISAAALFVVRALEQVKAGTQLIAILPDVLRSGSFQSSWRQRVSDLAEVGTIRRYGIFDESADIDVFLLELKRRSNRSTIRRWPKKTNRALGSKSVADFFTVHVGRVVPHRDPKKGPWHPYIHPRGLPTWKTMRIFSESRRHEGMVYKPPFVVIRRTSRPGHVYRAAATIIAGKRRVAVENHLIVCEPKDGKLATCRKLMLHLKSKTINDFLNQRIRCRHLTVPSVSELPWSSRND